MEPYYLATITLIAIYAIWALSRANARLHATVREMTQANLALSAGPPAAASLAERMEKPEADKQRERRAILRPAT